MPGIINNLYPPIINTLMPAFIYTQTCKVYFAISNYNKLSSEDSTSQTDIIDINKVQVIVQKQKTNLSVLKNSTYPSGIKITSLHIDENITDDNKYYIEINNNDIQGGFNLNQYYKVQIRFTDTAAASLPNRAGIDGWLSENLQHFSQWSTVTLIYGISKPTLSLNDFVKNQTNIFDFFDFPIIGAVSFDDNDKEIISNYQITIYRSNTLLEDSGIIYTNKYNNPNEINYVINYNLLSNINYTLKIKIQTKNFYVWTQIFTFKLAENVQPELKLNITTQTDEKNGAIKILFKNNIIQDNEESAFIEDTQKYIYEKNQDRITGKTLYLNIVPYNNNNLGQFSSAFYLSNNDELILYNQNDPYHDMSLNTRFIIKRSSNRQGNFNYWTTIGDITITEDNITEMIWTDYTVQLGVWYKYYIIRYSSFGERTSSIILDPKMVYSEDIFLTTETEQLRVRFDPQIASFSIKTSQSMTETIGSKYPFIQRNGNIKYKTFSLSGTITHFMDTTENLLNASKKDLYQEAYDLYENYNQENKINPFYDYVYERQYRNKVMNFLYQNNIKLFRSLTEGNIYIKLMDINFTPNNTLNRMIYSFSCTAYEVDNKQQIPFIKQKYVKEQGG